jgi:outer membrane protein assembly factor BamB
MIGLHNWLFRSCTTLLVFVGFFLSFGRTAAQDEQPMKPAVLWENREDFKGNDLHNPLIAKDKVIVGTDLGQLRAYFCSNGQLAWKHEHGSRIYHTPCHDDQNAYFTSENGLTAVSLKDGKEVWSFNRKSSDGPVFASTKKGLVYFASSNGNLYAFEAKTGQLQWDSDYVKDAPADPPKFPSAQARFNAPARPAELASDGEMVFLSIFDQSRIIAVNAADGKRLWSFQAQGWIYGTPVSTEKHVFIGSQDRDFYCLDKKTGKEIWKYKTNWRIESGGAVDAKSVYFGSCDGYVYCLNQADGKLVWKFELDRGKTGFRSPVYSVPALRLGVLYIAAGEGQVYAIDQASGKLNWKLRPSEGSELVCSPAIDERRIFVTSRATGLGNGKGETGAPSLIAIGHK